MIAPGPRTSCCVIGCRRSCKGRYAFHLCRDHWRMVPRALKQTHTKLWRRYRDRGEATSTEVGRWWESPRAWAACKGIWRRMIRAANQAAAGL